MSHTSIPVLACILLLLTGGLTAPATASSAAVTSQAATLDLRTPTAVAQGETASVTASATITDDIDAPVTIKVFRMDTSDKLCEESGDAPGTVSCSGSFTMPETDVDIRAYVQVGGRITDDDRTTITANAPADTTNPDSNTSTDTPTPPSQPDDTQTPPPVDIDSTTGVTDDDPGLLGSIFEGFTEAGRNGVTAILIEVFFQPAFNLVHELIRQLAFVLAWTPDVTGNPAVEDIHQLTLTVTFACTALALALVGLLYQVGPILGISYREVRLLIPRLIIALAFATISLPLLQLTVDITNALTLAFTPDLFETQLGSLVGTATGLLLVAVINAFLLVGVVALYVIRDVYLLFLAAISPLLALAWAMPRTRRYAAAFIGGWWTALAMGPLAMLVLTFVFALMDTPAGPATRIANWVYGVAGFTLLLLIPYQLYGASQMLTVQAFQTTGAVKRGAITKYQQVRAARTDPAEAGPPHADDRLNDHGPHGHANQSSQKTPSMHDTLRDRRDQ